MEGAESGDRRGVGGAMETHDEHAGAPNGKGRQSWRGPPVTHTAQARAVRTVLVAANFANLRIANGNA